jgi:hypothetical protein
MKNRILNTVTALFIMALVTGCTTARPSEKAPRFKDYSSVETRHCIPAHYQAQKKCFLGSTTASISADEDRCIRIAKLNYRKCQILAK